MTSGGRRGEGTDEIKTIRAETRRKGRVRSGSRGGMGGKGGRANAKGNGMKEIVVGVRTTMKKR